MNLVVTLLADGDYVPLAFGRVDRQGKLGMFPNAEYVMRDLGWSVAVLPLADLTLLLLLEHTVGDSPKFPRLIERREVALVDQTFQPIQILLGHLCSKKNAAGFCGGRLNILLCFYYTPYYGRTTIIFSLIR